MKKLLFVLGILCTALIIAGCGSERAETTEETTQAEEEVAAEETTEVAEQPAVEETVEETVVEEVTETAQEAATEEETVTEEVAAEESAETIEVEGCNDSDGGIDYDVAGSIVDARGTTDFDRCSENENYPGRLYENYCGEDGKRIRETYDCPSNKCSAGACVAAESTE